MARLLEDSRDTLPVSSEHRTCAQTDASCWRSLPGPEDTDPSILGSAGSKRITSETTARQKRHGITIAKLPVRYVRSHPSR
jgi:hypothetical protein